MAGRKRKPVEIDGRTGEGGGQLVRIAVGLSALTGIPISVRNVRGNRPGKQNGGNLLVFSINNSTEAKTKYRAEKTTHVERTMARRGH